LHAVLGSDNINFRMRAMVVSLPLIFGKIGESCIFSETILDYEPGIHYPQIQMQLVQRASIQFGFIVQLKTQKIMILKVFIKKMVTGAC
jgi:hypothetical protein